MRTATITLSIVVHVVAACMLIIAPLFATDTLPDPRTATEFVMVTPMTPAVPPPAPRAQPPTVAARTDTAPREAPNSIEPEIPRDPIDDAPALIDTALITGIGDGRPFVDVAPPAPAQAPPSGPVPVGGNIRPPAKVADVAPVYPAIARAAHVEGIVILEATIAEDGAVRDVRILRSIPLLDDAAVNAVRQWRFTPTLLNGQAVPVVMTVTVAFKLR